jgi:hypothetical protein
MSIHGRDRACSRCVAMYRESISPKRRNWIKSCRHRGLWCDVACCTSSAARLKLYSFGSCYVGMAWLKEPCILLLKQWTSGKRYCHPDIGVWDFLVLNWFRPHLSLPAPGWVGLTALFHPFVRWRTIDGVQILCWPQVHQTVVQLRFVLWTTHVRERNQWVSIVPCSVECGVTIRLVDQSLFDRIGQTT